MIFVALARLHSAPLAVELESKSERVDLALVQATLDGDRQAFDSLYQRHARLTHGRLSRLLGRDPEIEDLLQQVFLEAFRSLHRFRQEASFATWLYSITTNVALSRLRTRRRRPTEALSDEALAALVDAEASPEDKARTRQLAEHALAHLASLPPKFQVAFVLRHVEGLSLQEIAEIQKSKIPALRQRIRKAERMLADKIERDQRMEGVP